MLPSFSGSWQPVSSLSILACSFLGTCLPAKLELEGKSRTDGDARVGGENSCSIVLLLSPLHLPPTAKPKLGLPNHIGMQAGAVLKTKGFPFHGGVGCFPGPEECSPVSPRGEAGSGGTTEAAAVFAACCSGLLKEHHYDPNSRRKGGVMMPLANEQPSKWGTSNISIRASKSLERKWQVSGP